MNFILNFLVILFLTATGLASRARLDALQNKNHLSDTEIIYLFPTKVSELDPFVAIESGTTNTVNTSQGAFASGLVQIDPQTTLAVSAGRQNNLTAAQRLMFNSLNTETFELSQNPVEILWSYKNKGQSYGFGLFYSHQNDKINQNNESTQILQAGYRSGFLTLSVALPLINQVESVAAKKLNIADSSSVAVLYEIDNLTLSALFESFTATQNNSGLDVSALEYQSIEAALSDRTDFDRNHFFYKIDIVIKNLKLKTTSIKRHENQLPLTLGIESEYSDWLILRSSLKQTILISQIENVPSAQNNTQAAFGLGFKFKNLILDGTFTGLVGSAQTGVLSGDQFLSEVAITSWF